MVNITETAKLARELFSTELGKRLLDALYEQVSEEMTCDPEKSMVHYALGRFHLVRSWKKLVDLDNKTFDEYINPVINEDNLDD